MPEFANLTAEEKHLAREIAKRAAHMLGYDLLEISMDISVVSVHTPLRLKELLAARDLDFSHDISGIQQHLDRDTGLLMDGFSPRFAA